MKRLVKNLLSQKGGFFRAFAATRGISLDSGDATLGEAASPQANRLGATAKISSDLLVAKTGGGQQRDFRTQHQSRGGRTPTGPALQSYAVIV